ncbi:hypothetical protein ANCCAN_16113 [Ancylostoma caninum]|uniref:Uncharacterized protein n=1 Tax=Ancylostoma caninum TaxID=29170 RepID=A0A368G4T2_ANCCA|nr:hypothetical protein ANCCAN_16113 [Ancylostoma caninum]
MWNLFSALLAYSVTTSFLFFFNPFQNFILEKDYLIHVPEIAKARNLSETLEKIANNSLDTAPFITEHLVPPFYDYLSVHLTTPTYKLSTCMVEKTMTTLRTAISVFLENPKLFENNYDNITMMNHEKLRLVIFSKVFNREASKDYRCFGCNEDLNCFLEKLYEALWKTYNSASRDYDYDLAHFAPQTWYCEYRNNLMDFKLFDYKNDVNEVAVQLNDVYEKAGVPKKYCGIISRVIRKRKLNGSQVGKLERDKLEHHLLADDSAFRRLLQIYFYDFVVFGYKLPTFL